MADLSSPQLLQLCAMGKTIPKAKFEFMRADASDPIKYYEIEMENVLVAHVAPSVGAGAVMQESVALRASKMKWKYTQQKIGGGVAGNTTGGWDSATNRPA
jgi:type VI secretion system secreted protein Hcp